MPFKGRQINTIGYAKETTRNTAVTTLAKSLPTRSFTTNLKNEYRDDTSSTNRREVLLKQDLVKQRVEAEAEFTLDTDLIGELLFHAYGQEVPVTALGATTHTFSSFINSVQAPTFTLHHLFADAGWKYITGVNVTKIEVNIAPDDATIKTTLMGLSETDGTTQTVTVTKPSRSLLGRHLLAKFATTVAGLSSGTAMSTMSLSVAIDLGHKAIEENGSLNPTDIYANGTTAEIKFTGKMDATDYYTRFKSGTALAFEFDANAVNLPVLGTSALYPRLRFTVPPSLLDVTWSRDADDYVKFDATIKCAFSPTDGFILKTELQNTIASY